MLTTQGSRTLLPVTITVPGVGQGRMLLELYKEGDVMVCGVFKLLGFINAPPKRWLKIVRHGMQRLEQQCRDSGVQEMRVAGRNWSRVLPDYEPFDDVRNGLRKRL